MPYTVPRGRCVQCGRRGEPIVNHAEGLRERTTTHSVPHCAMRPVVCLRSVYRTAADIIVRTCTVSQAVPLRCQGSMFHVPPWVIWSINIGPSPVSPAAAVSLRVWFWWPCSTLQLCALPCPPPPLPRASRPASFSLCLSTCLLPSSSSSVFLATVDHRLSASRPARGLDTLLVLLVFCFWSFFYGQSVLSFLGVVSHSFSSPTDLENALCTTQSQPP